MSREVYGIPQFNDYDERDFTQMNRRFAFRSWEVVVNYEGVFLASKRPFRILEGCLWMRWKEPALKNKKREYSIDNRKP